ncbi:SIS domain-containing protein [Mixta intestinalis]|jgi:glucoselysine-6-phosphate deglycase|uniref:Glutamine--fructose-6-phosphate aminotransferase (Isomerizing) n=1 Tax=Mixta intestinalis TaxID=1615494 RepID=A0A6P1Q4D9_9GAMM|nr:SIS domain-containing protein [Mixta intestinalis]QHM73866.1 Glutamine--fructose-6-phosphate aminotransferase (isomerizing) [Mixta intestinalis]
MSITMMDCIEREPETLARILDEYPQMLAPVRERLAQGPVRRLLILATGSSMNAAQCAAYAFSEWAQIQVEIKEPYPFTHYERFDEATDWVIALSQSGKSHSTLQAQRKAQAAGRAVYCMTANGNSPLAQEADAILDINCGIEPVGFVTLGFSATVLNLLLIALMVGEAQGELSAAERDKTLNALRALTQRLPDVMRRTDAFITRHQALLSSAPRYVAIGYGGLVGVAKEFETKFTETVRRPSSGFELEAYMHGPYLEANAEHLLLFIEDAPDARSTALREYMRPHVKAALTFSADGDGDDRTLSLDFPLDPLLAPLLLIVPVQILAFRVATLKGIDLGVRIFDDFDKVLQSKI